MRLTIFTAALGLVLVGCGSCGTQSSGSEPADAALVTFDATNARPLDATAPDAERPAAPPTDRSVFSLVDNRHAAHRYVRGEFVIDGSTINVARYARSRWRIGWLVDGARASVADGAGVLEVPLDARLARSVRRLVVRVHSPSRQRFTIDINGVAPNVGIKTSTVTIVAGWQTIAFPVEPGRLVVGENQLTMRHSGTGPIAVEWLRLTGDPPPLGDPRGAIGFQRDALELDRDATALWYVTLPEGAVFVAREVTAGCRVEVTATAGDGSFAGGVVSARTTRVDLTRMAAKVVGLTVTARDCPRATVVAPELRVPVTSVASPATTKPPPPRHIIVWATGGMRADKLPTFASGARSQTPNLDELARSSTIFRNYYSHGAESRTSHTSLWTGSYPSGPVMTPVAAGEPPMLASELRSKGFTTIGVIGDPAITAKQGYSRGFVEFRNLFEEAGTINAVLPSKTVLTLALTRFDVHRDGPTLVWLGTLAGPACKTTGTTLAPAEIEQLRAAYDAAIAGEDELLGVLIRELKSRNVWDRTLLVITSDHGSELLEHDRCGAGSVRDSVVRVPLLIHDPPRFPGGTIIDEGVDAVDVMPTLLDAVGVAIPSTVQGRSLLPVASGAGRGWATPSYARVQSDVAMRIGRWKIRAEHSAAPMIYDMIADPSEQTDVAASHPVERRMLADNLGMFLALRDSWNKTRWGVTTNMTADGAAALDKLGTP